MATSRAERREQRVARVARAFEPADVEPALDLLEVMELAWHDVYGDVAPSDDLIDDVLLISHGTLDGLIGAVRLLLIDWRDIKVGADRLRES